VEIIIQVVLGKVTLNVFRLRPPDRAELIMTRGWDRMKRKNLTKRYSGLANGRLQCSYSGSLPLLYCVGTTRVVPNASSLWVKPNCSGGEVAARMPGP